MKQHFYILWGVCGISFCLIATTGIVQAQSIQIDGTTPTTPDTCSGSCNIGGGIQRGSNLFHSFSEFNVDQGATVLFLDPGVTNILTRVTGNGRSNILGTLGVSGGNANLFLINPNGIIFGSDAKLDVRGSFVGTTANAIQFGNQGFFRASASEIPLLTVNPSALFYESPNGVIQNNSIGVDSTDSSVLGLRVPNGQSLLLVGGEVNLDGGRLNAFGGRVELGGLAESGVIGLDVNNNNFRLSFPENTALADVSLTNGARVDVTANGGGSITVNAKNIGISGTQTRLFSGIRRGIASGKAGDITLNATGSVTVTDGSRILNRVLSGGQGNSGNINIRAGSLSLINGSKVQALTFGKGNAGNVIIDVPNGAVTVVSNLVSNLVDLSNDDKLSRIDSSVQKSSLPGEQEKGNGGNVEITARELYIKNGGFVNTGTSGRGDAGNISINVLDLVSLESAVGSGIFSNVSAGAVGNGGEINITTRSLSLTGGSQISASVIAKTSQNPGGQGNGGNILVNASDITISGTSPETGFSSGLFTLTGKGAEGIAGNITINTANFRISDGATVNAQTRNSNRGGNVTINATTFEAINGGQVFTTAASSGNSGNITVKATDRIRLSGSDPTFAQRRAEFPDEVQNEGSASGLFASTRADSTGLGGNIAIETGRFIIKDQAQVSVSSQGKGDAGNIDVNAHILSLENQGKLTSETQSGKGGNITLQLRDLLVMRRNSKISTNAGKAGSGGDGGDIRISVPNGFIVAAPLENNDITANAFFGNGGNIRITTKRIFGFVRRSGADIQRLDPDDLDPNNVPTSDITSFSQQNPSLNGTVQINSPDVDPSKGLAELPVNAVDASQQVAAECNASGKPSRSSFTVIGRGGVPSDPVELLTADRVLVDWIALEPEAKNSVHGDQNRVVISKQRNTERTLQKVNSVNQATQIVEAQGWVVDANGNVVLVAQIPTATLHNSAVASTSCGAK
ncbi:filamentous hemagglutinin N-terminal domain-containing protein [Desmonostoc muscorum CCALA 125]|nr:filamentous hemagglutinin N-terminal domain-containing protein [Desmonostoc muscorum CCALA 125]